MYKTWTASAEDATAVARALEAHLNEFADTVISVAYAVDRQHHVLAVYRPLEPVGDVAEETAVQAAELLLDEAQG